MDETDKTQKDSPQTEPTSEGSEGTTSGGVPETYTKEQVQKLISDERAQAGRKVAEATKAADKAAKVLEGVEQRAKDAEEALARIREEKDEAELQVARDNPDALNTFQVKKTLRTKETELKRKEQELSKRELEAREALEVVNEFRKEQKATEIGVQYGVDASILLAITDGSPEKMEAAAKALSQGKTKKETPAMKPDSGLTSGGAGRPTVEQLEAMSPEQYAEWAKNRYK